MCPLRPRLLASEFVIIKFCLVDLLETRVKSAIIRKIASVIDTSWTWVQNRHLHNKVIIL